MTNVAKLREAEAPAPDGLAKLREPFLPNQISKLPKPYKKDSPKGKCAECGGYHGLPAVHLDYVGHAALTDRLLDVDPLWTWEPMAVTPEGLPAFDRNGGLWIRLTICGVTRIGYGSADGKTGGDAIKEVIGDALRNGGMRFGAALDLWHKGDLHASDDGGEPVQTAIDMACNLLRGCGDAGLFKEAWAKNFEGWKQIMTGPEYARIQAVKNECVAKFVAEAEAAKAKEQPKAAPEQVDPFDDEIPF